MAHSIADSQSVTSTTVMETESFSTRFIHLLRVMWKHRWIYFLLVAPLIYFFIFKYIPLYNAQIAFKDYRPVLGIESSAWTGLDNLQTFIKSFYFNQLIINTVFFSIGKLILGMPMAIILALALYESQLRFFRQLVQTVSYLPHFFSWVIMFGVVLMMLSPSNGMINDFIKMFGGEPVAFLTSADWFRWVVILSEIWKDTGWSTIIYLAALLSIDPTLFESAAVDGASRFQRIWHISLPSILGVVVLVTLLRIGNILDGGFGQIFVLYSVPVYSVGDIIDTWVYRQGLLEFQFSLATAVGFFKGFFGLILLVVANQLAKRYAERSLY